MKNPAALCTPREACALDLERLARQVRAVRDRYLFDLDAGETRRVRELADAIQDLGAELAPGLVRRAP